MSIFSKIWERESSPVQLQVLSAEEIIERCNNNDEIIAVCVEIVGQITWERNDRYQHDDLALKNRLGTLRALLAKKGCAAETDEMLKTIAIQLGS
jgi:hypothetical protein